MQRSGIRFLEDFGVPEGGACLFCLLGVRGYLAKPLPNLPDSQYDYIRSAPFETREPVIRQQKISILACLPSVPVRYAGKKTVIAVIAGTLPVV